MAVANEVIGLLGHNFNFMHECRRQCLFLPDCIPVQRISIRNLAEDLCNRIGYNIELIAAHFVPKARRTFFAVLMTFKVVINSPENNRCADSFFEVEFIEGIIVPTVFLADVISEFLHDPVLAFGNDVWLAGNRCQVHTQLLFCDDLILREFFWKRLSSSPRSFTCSCWYFLRDRS